MNNAQKGALLSGLIIPGLGQVILKCYVRGAAMIVTVLISLAAITVKTVHLSLAILEKLQLEGGVITIAAIYKAATQAAMSFESFTFGFFFFVLMVCWIIGVVDAYIIGRKIDIKESGK